MCYGRLCLLHRGQGRGGGRGAGGGANGGVGEVGGVGAVVLFTAGDSLWRRSRPRRERRRRRRREARERGQEVQEVETYCLMHDPLDRITRRVDGRAR